MITNEAINRAIDYILQHINEPISVAELASHCNFSRFYFSRMFKMETGESIHEFIRRVKLEQSAFRLKVETGRSVTEVGLDYGYSASNYSAAFKAHHALSPVEFRRTILQKSTVNPIFQNEIAAFDPASQGGQNISVEYFADIPVLFERHKGSYQDLSARWGAFLETYKDWVTDQTLLLERTYDDPVITALDACLYDLCMTIPQDCPLPNTCVIEGGKYAIYHFKGPVEHIYAAYQCFFNGWLPQSRCELDDRYGFEIYRKIDCGAMYMEIDICFPLK